MVTRLCDTCQGQGEVLTMVPGFTGQPVEDSVDCPECNGEGVWEDPKWYDPIVGQWRRRTSRMRRRIARARHLWRSRDAHTVAAVISAHRNVLDDEPRLRGMIENQLMEQLRQETTLRWRQQDARHHLANAWRALRGQEPLPSPWKDALDISVSTENRDLFERNIVAIRAERHRRPA